jgi:hypothetical protein
MSKIGGWSLFSRELAIKILVVLEILMSECIDPWQPIVIID